MRAACYEKKGAPDVLIEGEMADPAPDADEVRIRLSGLGIGPGDIKKREDAFHNGRPYSRVIPHGDGAGTIGQLGDGVSADRIGQSVWCLGAQSYRPFDTAAQFVVVAVDPAKHLPDGIEVATEHAWESLRSPRLRRPGRTVACCWRCDRNAGTTCHQ